VLVNLVVNLCEFDRRSADLLEDSPVCRHVLNGWEEGSVAGKEGQCGEVIADLWQQTAFLSANILALTQNSSARKWICPYIFKVVRLLGVEIGWRGHRHVVGSHDSFLAVILVCRGRLDYARVFWVSLLFVVKNATMLKSFMLWDSSLGNLVDAGLLFRRAEKSPVTSCCFHFTSQRHFLEGQQKCSQIYPIPFIPTHRLSDANVPWKAYQMLIMARQECQHWNSGAWTNDEFHCHHFSTRK
jgi:hypothetical protein